MIRLFRVCLLLNLFHQIDGRSRRIDIFSQSSSDISQLRNTPKNVMYNVLPRNSPLKWTKVRDGKGNFVIPYMITGLYDPQEKETISDAMGRIEANTCIRFKKRIFERDFIEIQNQQNEGCYTNVGRLSGRNVVMLEANEMATCIEPDIVVHELMHAIGLWHEHMRYDRDDYITVHYENIDPAYHSQFEKISPTESTTYGIPYDYRSVMHYAETAFARRGTISMETKESKYQNVIGKQRDASPNDYKKICILYGCSVCMGEAFDWQNNDDPVTKTTAPPPILQPVTYGPPSGPTGNGECTELFSMFCSRMASRGNLDCRVFGHFCGCTCRSFGETTNDLFGRGFFQRVFSLFK